jgi:ubiquinone biosynthesis protein COQ4
MTKNAHEPLDPSAGGRHHEETMPAIPPPMPRRPFRWRRAWRSLRALLADPDDTEKAIDVVYAIGTGGFERTFGRVLRSPGGHALLRRRPSLAAALSDREALARLPAESLGRAYLAYLERTGFQPTGLLAVQERVQARWEREEGIPALDPVRSWFRDRFLLGHDLLHVVTDYGTDDVGEATLLAFSLAQAPGRAESLLTLGAAVQMWQELGRRWPRYVFQAWRRGRRAAFLAGLPWEDLLPLPLDTVRGLAAIEPSDRAHPGGILRGRFRAPSAMAST